LGASCTMGPSGLLFDSQVAACEVGQSALGLYGHCAGGRARAKHAVRGRPAFEEGDSVRKCQEKYIVWLYFESAVVHYFVLLAKAGLWSTS
jgi:hypothetical protein